MIRLALDAMGGDHAPTQIVDGAFNFLSTLSTVDDIAVILVGDRDAIETNVKRFSLSRRRENRITIAHASQTVEMHEKPAKILKTKPDSSLVRAVELVKSGEADAVISAGNTGALLSSSLFLLGRIPGVRRPALGPHIPTAHGGFLLCDAGANVDVKAIHLMQFGLMARVYSQYLFNIPNPRIGILNIGAETGKGNELTLEAYELMSTQVENFIGNIEARDLFMGVVDVVVCDGFVGNILLKFAEGMVQHVTGWARDKLKQHPISQLALPLMKPALKDLSRDLDYEEYGGSPLLGVNGVSLVCHGSSSQKAITSALKTATRCVRENLIERIRVPIQAHLDIVEKIRGQKS